MTSIWNRKVQVRCGPMPKIEKQRVPLTIRFKNGFSCCRNRATHIMLLEIGYFMQLVSIGQKSLVGLVFRTFFESIK
jgi:hypothetical protein